ncbi:MAG: ABC transporter ATP-binding protein [Coriobacteriia bacterium]|nr:ABC transporter ATP-binding protein [Coriobacteriia bacterium]
MIEVKNLDFAYKGRPHILKDLSFTVPKGSFCAILGNNGVGKSTLLKCFNKILTPKSGEILCDGENLLALRNKDLAKKIAYVSQNVPITQLTVHDVVMLGRKPYMSWHFSETDHMLVHEAMDKLLISELRGRYVSELSGGERQKVMLARALSQEPRILLLDEPTSSLDIYGQYRVLEIIKEICEQEGITALIVLHDLNLALRFCNHFILLHEGAVYAYGDSSILRRQSLKDVYGIDGEVALVRGYPMISVD